MNFLKSKINPKIITAFYVLIILIPVLLVFRSIFWERLPTWGDAPYFYPEGLRELFSEPLTWVNRGQSFGGGNSILWISPMMFLFGVLNKFLYLGNDSIVRILFYFPSIILAAIGPYFLTRYLKFSRVVSFFSVLTYILSTYYLLLVDGGQVGVALAYGLFPLVILFGKKMLDAVSIKSFSVFLLASFLISVIDPRVFVVCFLTLFVWQIFINWRKLIFLVAASIILIPLDFYWIFPLIRINDQTLNVVVTDLQLSSILNSLFLYAPHWPSNIFGKVVQPPFYFCLIPFLIFGNLLFKQRNKKVIVIVISFMILAFISKGSTPPIGEWYDFLVKRLPFGFAFRDSSKFFIPLVLFGGILIGEIADRLYFKFKIAPIFIYIYLMFLISPAILGKLNFNLSNRKVGNDFNIIYQNLRKDDSFFRTAWFPERHPLAFETEGKPAIDVRDLVKMRPLAYLNASEDVFNFLYRSQFISWFRVLGIKYLILSGNVRNPFLTDEETKNWEKISTLVNQTPDFEKQAWGTNVPVYKVSQTLPKTYVVDKLIAVVGPDLPMNNELIPAVYFEDGKFKPEIFAGKSSESVKIYFNGKDDLDLAMSFLQNYFKSTMQNKFSQWAILGSNDYLKTKYELLIRGLNYNDFDYNKGLAFSTIAGERLDISIEVPISARYVLAVRSMKEKNAKDLKVRFSGANHEINSKENSFGWTTFGPFDVRQGNHLVSIENGGGFQLINAIALVSEEKYRQALSSADIFVKHFGTVDENALKDKKPREVKLAKEGILKFGFIPPDRGYWLILTDNYNPLWRLRKGVDYLSPVPVYSAVNGLYFDPKWSDLHVEFEGQDYFRWGVWVSLVSVLFSFIIYLFIKIKNDERQN